jgi:hypothetical protein
MARHLHVPPPWYLRAARGGTMPDNKKVQGLAAVSGYLCSACEELTAAGYRGWSSELEQLIEIIGMEIGWLERDAAIPALPPQD